MNDSLRDTIEPKSDQLNADDLIAGPITVTVEDVRRGTGEQPIDVHIVGHRPYRPCKSMRRVLIAVWGENGKDWVGKSMTLYCDPSVRFGGVAVGGIRISHMSGLDQQRDLMLTTTRSKRSPYTVRPLIVEQAGMQFDDINRELHDCQDAQTLAKLKTAARAIYSGLSAEFKTAIQAAISDAEKRVSQCQS